jgi:hypothetical protein
MSKKTQPICKDKRVIYSSFVYTKLTRHEKKGLNSSKNKVDMPKKYKGIYLITQLR